MTLLRFGSWRFEPGLAASIATLIVLPLFIALGFWQLHRAAEKTALREAAAAQARLPPLDINAKGIPAQTAAVQWRRLRLVGRWAPARQVLLDNQVDEGQAGYLVFTPFRLDGDGRAILVDRGWVGGGPLRTSVPDVVLTSKPASLVGVAAPPPAAGVGSRNDVDASLGGGLLRVERLDVADLSARLGMPLLPWTLRLDPAAPDGFRRDWRPPGFGPERHIAYAVQWFLFAAILVGLYVKLNLRGNGGGPAAAEDGRYKAT